MAVLEMRAGDLHAVLGRLLDQVRMADLLIAELSVRAQAGAYVLRLPLDTQDRGRRWPCSPVAPAASWA